MFYERTHEEEHAARVAAEQMLDEALRELSKLKTYKKYLESLLKKNAIQFVNYELFNRKDEP